MFKKGWVLFQDSCPLLWDSGRRTSSVGKPVARYRMGKPTIQRNHDNCIIRDQLRPTSVKRSIFTAIISDASRRHYCSMHGVQCSKMRTISLGARWYLSLHVNRTRWWRSRVLNSRGVRDLGKSSIFSMDNEFQRNRTVRDAKECRWQWFDGHHSIDIELQLR